MNKKIKKELFENEIIGRLMWQEKYKFTDKNLIAEVVRDVLKMQKELK